MPSKMQGSWWMICTIRLWCLTILRQRWISRIWAGQKCVLNCLDFITANIAGYSRGGIESTEWEQYFHPLLMEFGWTCEIIQSTSEIVFYEYSRENFKMVLAKIIRPKKDGEIIMQILFHAMFYYQAPRNIMLS